MRTVRYWNHTLDVARVIVPLCITVAYEICCIKQYTVPFWADCKIRMWLTDLNLSYFAPCSWPTSSFFVYQSGYIYIVVQVIYLYTYIDRSSLCSSIQLVCVCVCVLVSFCFCVIIPQFFWYQYFCREHFSLTCPSNLLRFYCVFVWKNKNRDLLPSI